MQIPTNKPIQRKDLPDQVFDTIDHKYKAVAKKVKELHAKRTADLNWNNFHPPIRKDC